MQEFDHVASAKETLLSVEVNTELEKIASVEAELLLGIVERLDKLTGMVEMLVRTKK